MASYLSRFVVGDGSKLNIIIMEKLMIFGKDLENLISLITDQIEFNPALSAESLYDEITDQINAID